MGNAECGMKTQYENTERIGASEITVAFWILQLTAASSCRIDRGDGDSHELIGFVDETGDLVQSNSLGVDEDFEPKLRFVGFFFRPMPFSR